ncbi:MAG: hypothetical protein ACRDBY_14220 [Cetobacterium sp.]
MLSNYKDITISTTIKDRIKIHLHSTEQLMTISEMELDLLIYNLIDFRNMGKKFYSLFNLSIREDNTILIRNKKSQQRMTIAKDKQNDLIVALERFKELFKKYKLFRQKREEKIKTEEVKERLGILAVREYLEVNRQEVCNYTEDIDNNYLGLVETAVIKKISLDKSIQIAQALIIIMEVQEIDFEYMCEDLQEDYLILDVIRMLLLKSKKYSLVINQ